jgi:hypothetical protein
MKNITVSLDDEVSRWVRVWAAEHELSVSRMIGQMLRGHMQAVDRYRDAMDDYLSRGPAVLSKEGTRRRFSREELHERADLR